MEYEKAVRQYADLVANRSSIYKTRETINVRVIKLTAKILDIQMRTVHNTEHQIEVDPDLSMVIERLWKKGQIYINSISKSVKSDFDAIMERFLSRDFMNPSDLTKFCQALQKVKYIDDAQQKLWILFAVDGIKDTEYKNYMNNLSICLEFGDKPDNMNRDDKILSESDESPEVIHVRAIRSIYQFLTDVKPEILNEVMKKVHNLKDSNDNEIDSEDEDNVQQECIENYYRKLVGRKLPLISTFLEREKLKFLKIKNKQDRRKKSDEEKRERSEKRKRTTTTDNNNNNNKKKKDKKKKLIEPTTETNSDSDSDDDIQIDWKDR